jgi:hypothetical protein
MTGISYFEKASGAFLLWVVSLIISCVVFFSYIGSYLLLSSYSIGLFLLFFITWGVVYVLIYGIVAVYFFIVLPIMSGSRNVPSPPSQTLPNSSKPIARKPARKARKPARKK